MMFSALGALECRAQPYVLHLANKTECDYSIQVGFCNATGTNITLYSMATVNMQISSPAQDVRVNILGNPVTELAVSFEYNSPYCNPIYFFDPIGSNPCGTGQYNISILNDSIFGFFL